jgi:DNA-binding transcriptional LysR family regulator
MTKLQIDYFIAVAKCGGFTKAAQALYTTQPTITQQINTLEKNLGFRLFKRQPGKTILTESGEIMLECFLKFSADFDAALAEAKKADSTVREITVGFLTSMDMGPVAQYINNYSRAKEGLNINIIIGTLGQLLDKLQTREITIAFLFDNQVEGFSRFSFEPLFRSERKLILSVNHPLAGKPNLTLADVIDEQFIAYKPDTKGILDMHDKLYARLGLKGVNTVFVPDIETIYSMVDGGFGVAIADEHSTFLNSKKFRIQGTGNYCELGIARLNEKPAPAVKELLRGIRECASGNAWQ